MNNVIHRFLLSRANPEYLLKDRAKRATTTMRAAALLFALTFPAARRGDKRMPA